MIQPSYKRLFNMLCLFLVIGLFTACKKNEDPNSGKVELLSFGPTGARHGDTLHFIGRNLNKVTAIQFTGTNAVVDQKSFKQQTGELILLLVPDAAEKGYVTLKTPDGDVVSKTQFNLNVKTTASVALTTKQSRPGENITLSGNFLNWVKKITFNKDKVVSSFVSQSINQLVVKVPDDAQTGPLLVTLGGTDSADVQTADTLKVALPLVASFSPNPVKHADNVTITGTDLDLTKKVIFSGVSTPVTIFVSQSATQLVVKVPAATTKGKVKLEAASGVQTTSSSELNVLLPAIASFTPTFIDPGADLTITGTNLDLVSSVSFVGATSAVTSFVSQSPTQLVVTVPTGVLKGRITLGVKNSSLTVQSATDLDIKGGLPPLADFTLPIYTDANQNGFQDWSYTLTHDFNNTENVRQGTNSIKAVYGADPNNGQQYQGITFHHNTGVSTSGYTTLEFSVYGEPGTEGKKLNVVINGAYGSPKQVTIVGGEWTTYSLLLSDIGSPDPLKEVVLQAAGWSGTLHIDHVGLR